jgi:hypothetical protein
VPIACDRAGRVGAAGYSEALRLAWMEMIVPEPGVPCPRFGRHASGAICIETARLALANASA